MMVVGVVMILVLMGVALMVVLMTVLVRVLTMVMMTVLVRVLGSCFVAVEPGHVMVVVLELPCQLNVKVAGVDAMLVYACNGNFKAADRKRGELLAQMLLAGAQVE